MPLRARRKPSERGLGRLLSFLALAATLVLEPGIAHALDVCRSWFETRTAIPVWTPELNDKGNLSEEPPTGEGTLVYIRIGGDTEHVECHQADAEHLYSFSLPQNPEDSGAGGLAVNIRGQAQFANGFCYLSGLFMNKPVFGLHQGWHETYFGEVDSLPVTLSGRFCLQREP